MGVSSYCCFNGDFTNKTFIKFLENAMVVPEMIALTYFSVFFFFFFLISLFIMTVLEKWSWEFCSSVPSICFQTCWLWCAGETLVSFSPHFTYFYP